MTKGSKFGLRELVWLVAISVTLAKATAIGFEFYKDLQVDKLNINRNSANIIGAQASISVMRERLDKFSDRISKLEAIEEIRRK